MASSVWRFTDDKGVEREISTVDLRAALMKGSLLPSTLVWREGMKEWVPAFTLPDLASAAIAAARVDRTKAGPPSVPPGVPVQKHKPTQTLQGIDPASLGNEAAAALAKIRGPQAPVPKEPPREPFERASAPEESLEEAANRIIAPAGDPMAVRVVKTQPTGSVGSVVAGSDIIPKAPKLPTLDAGARPKSIPPPLPPRSARAPILAPADTPNVSPGRPPLPRKQTLLGMSAALGPGPAPTSPAQGPRSRPPPPPRRTQPSVPPGAAPPAPQAATPRPPLVAPKPPKRSVRPPAPEAPSPGAPLPPQLTPTELAPVPNQPAPAAEPRHVGQTTATLGTVTTPQPPPPEAAATPVVEESTTDSSRAPTAPTASTGTAKMANLADEATDQLSKSQLLGAHELLASIGQTQPEDENTVTLTRSAGEIVKEVRAPQARAAKVPKRVQLAQQQQQQQDAAIAAAAVEPEKTGPLPILGGAVEPASAEPARAPLPRQRTMEMSLSDHKDAAMSQPIPASQRGAAVSVRGAESASKASTPAAEPKATPSTAPSTKSASTPPPEHRASRPDRASFTNEDENEDGEYKIKRRVKPPVEVPRRSIVGASLLWMVGLVIFFFVGRCAGYSRASQFVPMRTGAGRTFLAWSMSDGRPVAPVSTAPEEVKPCWVARQPTKWAPSATKYVPIDMEPIDGSMSFGFGLGETEAAGIVVEPKSGKFEQVFNKKLEAKEKAKIARVVPMPSREGGYFISKKGERDWMPILGADPFFLVFSKESIGWAASDDAEPTEIFALTGTGDVTSQRVLDEGTNGYFLSFRQGNVVYGGYFDKQKKALGALVAVPGSSEKAEQGKPKSGFNGEETAVIFAERAATAEKEPKAPWTVRLGHAKAGTVPTATEVLTFPSGGPGGDVFAPDVVGLPDGRWLVMWTEGDATSAIRALTYSKDFQPIGDPIALSPPGDFGQAVLGNAAGYTIVAFFQRNAQGDFELWGAVLKCG